MLDFILRWNFIQVCYRFIWKESFCTRTTGHYAKIYLSSSLGHLSWYDLKTKTNSLYCSRCKECKTRVLCHGRHWKTRKEKRRSQNCKENILCRIGKHFVF